MRAYRIGEHFHVIPFCKNKELWQLPADISRALSIRRYLDNATETMAHFGKAPPPSKRIVFNGLEFGRWVEFARAHEERERESSYGARPVKFHDAWKFDTVADMRVAYGG